MQCITVFEKIESTRARCRRSQTHSEAALQPEKYYQGRVQGYYAKSSSKGNQESNPDHTLKQSLILECSLLIFCVQICHNPTGEINPKKIKNLIEAYVRKFRYRRKNAATAVAK